MAPMGISRGPKTTRAKLSGIPPDRGGTQLLAKRSILSKSTRGGLQRFSGYESRLHIWSCNVGREKLACVIPQATLSKIRIDPTCMSLPDCDLCHSIPGELDELVERGFKQPLDVAMRTEIDLVLCTRRGADSIALDSLRPQLGHVTRTCGHAGEYRRTRVHLSTYFLQGTVHLGVEARGGRWGSGSGHWHDSDRRIGNHASY